MTEDQNLTKWKLDLKVYGKKIWPRFYKELLGSEVSSLPRLYRAVNLYGDDIVFDAIVDSSWRELTGDGLNYVLKVASEKWKQQRAEIDGIDTYAKTIEEAKEISLQKNMALAKKLKKGEDEVVQLVPFANEFEQAVIVCILRDPQIFPKISGIIQAEDLYKTAHIEIFRAISSLEVDTIDSLTVQEKLRPETLTYFKTLVEDADRILPTTSNALFYAETIKHKSKLRAGIDLGQQIIATCYQEQDADEAIQNLEDMFASFLQKRVLEDKSESSTDAFRKFIDSLQVREPEDPNSIKSGFFELDMMTQRMEGLIVLGGRPGTGKTAFAANIALNVSKRDQGVLFFSLEQGEDQIFERMLAAESEVPLEDIRLGVFRNDEVALAKVEKAEQRLAHLMQKMHIDDRANVPTSYITSVARQKKYEWGEIGLIVVDYLHIMQLKGDNKVDALGAATNELRSLGKELGCPVLLLSQLRRQEESGKDIKKNKRPDLQDLRSSGEIEQIADMVWFLYRDSYYEQAGLQPEQDLMEVLIRKNRSGRQGIVMLEWLPTIMKFKDIERLNFRGKK